MGFPTKDDISRYAVNVSGEAEIVRQSLYDFQICPAAGAQSFTFFAQPIGAGQASSNGAAAGAAKTKLDTNMTLAGQLPNPQAFIVECIELYFQPGAVSTANVWTPALPAVFAAANSVTPIAAMNDVNTYRQSGGLRFFIGSKEYLFEQPLVRFPQKANVRADAAIGTTSATAGAMSVVTPWVEGRPYYLEVPISLVATQNFSITVEFAAAITMPSTFNARIGVVLDGFLFRNAQ